VTKFESCMSLLKPTLSYGDLGRGGSHHRSGIRNHGCKKEVFSKLDTVARPGAILASNTSYLSIDEIAGATSRPSAWWGSTFFAAT